MFSACKEDAIASEDCIFQHHLILSIIGGRCYSIEAMFFSADYFQIHEIFLLKSVDMLKKDKCLTLHKCR